MFKFYPKATPTFPFSDYQILLDEVARLEARSVLEFGPGSSTWAFLEAGVDRILACEYDEYWAEESRRKFHNFPQYKCIPYRNTAPLATADIGNDKFDLGFVDSPKGYVAGPNKPKGGREVLRGQEDCSRLNTLLLALEYCPVVLLHDATRPLERASLGRCSALGHDVYYFPQSSYGMARVTRCQRPDENSSIAL